MNCKTALDMSRRQFAASLGAGIILLPFLRSQALAQTASAAPVQRLLILTTLGTIQTQWQPTAVTAPNAFQYGPAIAPLATVKDKTLLVNGLSFENPTIGHGGWECLTGSTQYGASSVDQYILDKLSPNTKLRSLTCAVQGSNFGQGSHIVTGGAPVTPLFSPTDAFNACFAATTATTTAAGAGTQTKQRTSILDLASTQIKRLQGSLGTQEKNKLGEHLNAIEQLEKSLSATTAANCTAPAAPAAVDPTQDSSTAAIGQAHLDIIINALACGVTNVASLQYGRTDYAYLSDPAVMDNVHQDVHGGEPAKVQAADNYFSNQMISLINALAQRPDPSGSGTLLDSTMVVWARDISDGPTHRQFSLPYVLAGATKYLKYDPNGLYINMGGSDANQTPGARHEKLLLNICEAMGVTDYSGFGSLQGSDKAPLTQIKA